jgi:hypothetical protein
MMAVTRRSWGDLAGTNWRGAGRSLKRLAY